MSVTAAIPAWIFYTGDGATTTFPYPWRLLAATDLEVYEGGMRSTAYSLTGIGGTGGNVVMYNPPALSTPLFFRRVTARTQSLDYVNGDPFSPETHESGLDKVTLLVQDLLEDLSRRPALTTAIPSSARGLLFPSPVGGKLLGWNANGSGLTLYDATIVTVTVDDTSGIARGKSSATLNASTLAGLLDPLTAGALIPATSKVLYVTYRCKISFSTVNGLASVHLGGMGLVDGWGRALGITAPTMSGYGHGTRADQPNTVNAESVLLTPNGGAWGPTGQARVTAHWETLTPDE